MRSFMLLGVVHMLSLHVLGDPHFTSTRLVYASTNLEQYSSTEAATSQISDYMASLVTGTAFSSVLAVLETDTSATDAIESIWTSIQEGSHVNAEAVMSAFPTQVQPFYASLFSMESSILSANGFTTNNSSASSSSTSGSSASSTSSNDGGSSSPTSSSTSTSSGSSSGTALGPLPTKTGSSAVSLRGETVGLSAAAMAGVFVVMLAL